MGMVHGLGHLWGAMPEACTGHHVYRYDSPVGGEIQQLFAVTAPFRPVSAIIGDQPFPFRERAFLRKGLHINFASARFVGGIRSPFTIRRERSTPFVVFGVQERYRLPIPKEGQLPEIVSG